MNKIVLKSLTLTNFKGIRSLDLQFSEQGSVVSGENGTGKTTVFDAFTWLLFGKDSTGRSDANFNIKTLDADGKPILKLEHSVSAVLDVDGRTIKLQRSYVEKWVKPRGTTEETLKNHETEFYINDVKLSTKREYEAEINSIMPEDVFRMVTNPFYFTSLKPEVQKQMLFDMAGNVTDDEVASIKPEYIELLAQLSGRSLAQYAKEVAAKKKACKDELAVIPSQIDTANRLRPAEDDWVALDAELQSKQNRIAEIDAQIADRSKVNEAEYERKSSIQKEIGEKKMAIVKRESEISAQAQSGMNEATMKLRELEYKLREANTKIQNRKQTLANVESYISKLDHEMDALRGKYREVNALAIQYPEGAFVCPTCKRALDVEDIEAKQAELQANFNQDKASKLKVIQSQGKSKGAERENYSNQRLALHSEIADLEAELDALTAQVENQRKSIPEAPNVEQLQASDQNLIDLKNQIVELENQLKMDAKTVDVSDLKEAKRILSDSVKELNKRLANRLQIERVDKEIADLEEKRIANNQKLADLEKWEFTAISFQKDKDAKLLERINGLFSIVSFSFVADQLNGGERLTCVCTVNGTPYPDVNQAGKVNAGLDIINAICKARGFSAPIFIDNRESVNEIIPTISQVINLCVSRDKSLIIK